MKSLKLVLIGVLTLFAFSCTKKTCQDENDNKVLMLQVDYITNVFEGGQEIELGAYNSSFATDVDYQAPGDFGSIKILYQPTNQTLFHGTIHWMGLGQRIFPASLIPANNFELAITNDFITPSAGFENIFNPTNTPYFYMDAWSAVQKYQKVRAYLQSNNASPVKIFLYMPSAGPGDPTNWKWILFLKN